MKSRIPAWTLVLLSTLCAGPVLAEQPARLPGLSAALQSRIDGRMSAALSREREVRREASASESARFTGHRTERSSEQASGRTDESGWKPYHSVM